MSGSKVVATAAALVLSGVLLGMSGTAGVASAVDRRVEFEWADPEIVESSGLVARGGLFATVNDSGDVGRTFVVDPTSGETVGGAEWGEATDIEALAPMPEGDLLVGDIGDNAAVRKSVRLVQVPMQRGDAGGEVAEYRLRYPGGARDAESLLVHPVTGQVLVVSKGLFAGTMYAAPQRLDAGRTNRLREVGDVIGLATDGAFFPDGRHLVLRTYSRAVIYSWPQLQTVGSMTLPSQPQGEGIAVDERARVFICTEGAGTPVLRVRLPRELRDQVSPQPAPSPSPTASPSPQQSDSPDPVNDEGNAEPRSAWIWLAYAGGGLVLMIVLLRSLRPPGGRTKR